MMHRHQPSRPEIISPYFSVEAQAEGVSGISSPSARVSGLCFQQQLCVRSANSRRGVQHRIAASHIIYNVGGYNAPLSTYLVYYCDLGPNQITLPFLGALVDTKRNTNFSMNLNLLSESYFLTTRRSLFHFKKHFLPLHPRER